MRIGSGLGAEDCPQHAGRRPVPKERDGPRDYGFSSIRDDSPRFRDFGLGKDRVVLNFDNVDEFYIYNQQYCSTSNGFEICGADGVWKPAQVMNFRKVTRNGKPHFLGNFDGGCIVLSTAGVESPKGVRYLYSHPWYGAIYNEVGLPLGSFTVDL